MFSRPLGFISPGVVPSPLTSGADNVRIVARCDKFTAVRILQREIADELRIIIEPRRSRITLENKYPPGQLWIRRADIISRARFARPEHFIFAVSNILYALSTGIVNMWLPKVGLHWKT